MVTTTPVSKRQNRARKKMATSLSSSSLLLSLILFLTGNSGRGNGSFFGVVSALPYLYSTDATASSVIEEYIENSSHGDFFQSMGPRVVEFYNPSCVSFTQSN